MISFGIRLHGKHFSDFTRQYTNYHCLGTFDLTGRLGKNRVRLSNENPLHVLDVTTLVKLSEIGIQNFV